MTLPIVYTADQSRVMKRHAQLKALIAKYQAQLKELEAVALEREFAHYELGAPRTVFPHSRDWIIEHLGAGVWNKYATQTKPPKKFTWNV